MARRYEAMKIEFVGIPFSMHFCHDIFVIIISREWEWLANNIKWLEISFIRNFGSLDWVEIN